MSDLKDVFISYGRRESKAFATRLHDRLCEQGYQVWFDQNDIPLAVDFQDEIDEGIARADNFLFIIAPHSINSPYCLKEVELALRFKKRIIPILHIEQFGKEVWQERTPQGTEEDWKTFQEQGLHTSFSNMHPEIGKRNWVYMRERCLPNTPIEEFPPEDDFEQNFIALLKALQHHQSYVRQHTLLLNKALEWEGNQRVSQYLLVGEERKEAEKWMLRKFDKEQPPVIPSDLHCQYISEARKNAENRMTDIFICYATEDRLIRDKVILALSRYCITSWTHDHDIESGQDFGEAIEEGVEKADNVLFFISKHAVRSPHCLSELRHALQYNKRIIPLLIEPLEEQEFPEEIRHLQYIDFTDNAKEDDFYDDIGGIIRLLETDKTYHERHKMLLVQALKWERQEKNPSILLRGHNLQRAQAWLKIGIQRKRNRPHALHERFISESAAQTGSLQSIDIFISYSRTDSDFARKLNDRLQLSGKTTWFDQENIEEGVADFGEEIRKGIEQSDNFLFIISPDSVRSPYCAEETQYARALGKRIITVRWRELTDDLMLPEALSTVQWIRADKGFEPMYNLLIRALEVDRVHVEGHGRWQRKALEWSGGVLNLKEDTRTDNDLLLRGTELESAVRWLEESKDRKPHPTTLQRTFIERSQQEATKDERRKSRILDLAILAFAVIIAAAVLAGTQLVRALERGDRLATYNLLFEAQNLLQTDSVKALQLAKTAYEIEREKSERAIQDFFQLSEQYLGEKTGIKPQLFRRLSHAAPLIGAYANEPSGSNLLTLDAAFGVRLWGPGGNLIRELVQGRKPILDLSTKNIFERIDALYTEYVKYEFNAVWYGSSYVALYLPDQQGSRLWVWTGEGSLLFTKDLKYPIKGIQFVDAPSGGTGWQLRYVVKEGKEYIAYYTDREGNLIKSETEHYFAEAPTTRLFSPSSYQKGAFHNSSLQIEFLSDGESFQLSYPPQASSSDTLFVSGDDIPQERFAIVGLPMFWNEQVMVLTENSVLLWKPYYEFRQRLERELGTNKSLTSAEKVAYDIATIPEAFQIDYEASYQLAKVLFFFLLFFLSNVLLSALYRRYLSHRYLSIVMYSLCFIIIAICWSQFLVYRGLFIALSFSYGLIAAGIGGYLTWRTRFEQDVLKVSLRASALILLAVLALLCMYFGRAEYFGSNETLRMQSISLVLFLGLTKVSLLGLMNEGLKNYYQGNHKWQADRITAWIFLAVLFITTSYYYGASDTNEKEELLGFFFIFFLPLLYVIRFNMNQFVLAKVEKVRSSRRIIRFSVFGFAFIVLISLISILSMAYIFIAFFLFGLYLFIEYVASFVVAIIQKDRFSLVGNILSTIGLITAFFLWSADVVTRHDVVKFFPFALVLFLLAFGGRYAWRRYKNASVPDQSES